MLVVHVNVLLDPRSTVIVLELDKFLFPSLRITDVTRTETKFTVQEKFRGNVNSECLRILYLSNEITIICVYVLISAPHIYTVIVICVTSVLSVMKFKENWLLKRFLEMKIWRSI